ncbi:PTS system fructose-specific IIC component [Salmonella enterica subsp. enterica]|uniref:PTS system fructose-specific IIC component n=1 Tax=Salmonella enterica I TaxID=59201 RepID=A0A447TQN9_SALET|nr:PTS system fructose-specific IIC component [Salmonella enterica subsp. enterica]VEC94503.1 PTS system fructose-specific IIC component [Salmonella enterica subsp. enterica]
MKELVQILKNTRQHLMTGVSHMIPFVVAGGIFAGSLRHAIWQGRRTRCRHRSES